jgi:hypothetical protein
VNSTCSACTTLYNSSSYSACLLYTSYVCLASKQLSNSCLRESFAPSTVYGLLLLFLSTRIICTQYSLCSSTSCDNDFYSTSTASMQPPRSSTPTARTCTLCASLPQYLSIRIICTKYSLRSSTSCPTTPSNALAFSSVLRYSASLRSA